MKYPTGIDWLTLATYNFAAHNYMAAFLREYAPNDWSSATWLQYKGYRQADNSIFYGHATQSNGKEHYVFTVSGTSAAFLWQAMEGRPFLNSFYCTRIDIQVTKPAPDWWEPREVYDYAKGKAGASTIIESETGNTVYLGSRKSGRYARLYEKFYSKRKWVRLEIELKQQHARNAFDFLQHGATPSDIFGSHLTRIRLKDEWLDYYRPEEHDILNLRLIEIQSTMLARLQWLNRLIPTFQQMVNDDTIGDMVKEIFYSLYIEQKGKHDE